MDKKENIRIIDIAKMAKVSVGTVDRVLHNRGRVSEEKRQQVEKVLKEIDYKPNMVARFLASKRTFSFAAIIPSYQLGEYWELVSNGIDKAVSELSDFNITVDYLHFDQFDDTSFQKTVKDIEEADYAGVIVATLHKSMVIDLSKKLDEAEIPYVYIDSDIPNCNNLSYFGSDSHTSGAIAAKLMMLEISAKDNILIAQTKYKHHGPSTQIENRESGFREYLNNNNFEGNILSFDFNPNNPKESSKELETLLNNTTGNVGAIIFNSRIYELVGLVDKINNRKKIITLVGYDPITKNTQALKNNNISYLISQRSVQQGYESVRALSTHLIFNGALKKQNFMSIDILIKENVDFYND